MSSFGGGGRTDGRMDGRMYVIFAPVSYRTSALWGRCPKRNVNEVQKDKEKRVKAKAAKGMIFFFTAS